MVTLATSIAHIAVADDSDIFGHQSDASARPISPEVEANATAKHKLLGWIGTSEQSLALVSTNHLQKAVTKIVRVGEFVAPDYLFVRPLSTSSILLKIQDDEFIWHVDHVLP